MTLKTAIHKDVGALTKRIGTLERLVAALITKKKLPKAKKAKKA
jgi:hypothetical protein